MSRPLACLLLVAASGCDLPIEGEDGTGPVVVESRPVDGATEIDRAGPFVVRFDRPVFPRDLHRGRIRVQSGSWAAFLSAWLEPVDRELQVELLGDPLEPRVRYRFLVEGVRDLGLVPMAERWEVTFETGDDATRIPPETRGWVDAEPILARCASGACHGGDDPALGLDLSSPPAIRETAIGVTAERSRIGTQADVPWHGAATLEGLARVDVIGGVGRPARSFLMYTLLEEGGAGHFAPLDPPLSREELRTLSLWIRSGAPTE